MELKAIVDSLDGMDEGVAGLYAEHEGKYRLNIEGMEHSSDVQALKQANLRERENSNAIKKALGLDKVNPDAINETITSLRAQIDEAGKKGGKSNEEHAALIAQMKADHAKELSSWEEKFTGLNRKNAVAELKAELAKAGVIEEGIDLLAMSASARIKFHDDGTPRVVVEDGETPMVGSGKDGGATIADLAKGLASSVPQLVRDNGKGGSGKQPGSNGGKPPQHKTIDRATLDSMPQEQRSTFFKEGGRVTDSA